MSKANTQARMDAVAAALFIDLKDNQEFSTMKQYQP